MKITLSVEQQKIFDAFHGQLSVDALLAIARQQRKARNLTESELLEFLKLTNLFYRSGEPLISDADYDFLYCDELRRRSPGHPFLHSVEPEVATKTVALPVRMLSTDKAYDFETVQRWAARIDKAAQEHGKEFSSLLFRVTPKLDGYAAYDDGRMLYTRGDGHRGTDITRAFDRGLQVAENGVRGLGAGEIVVSKSWFSEKLATDFENSRNVQAALIKEKQLDPLVEETITSGKAVFFPFVLLPDWQGTWQQLAENFQTVIASIWHRLDYDIDGVVLEIIDEELKEKMGATRHHNRWQIAYKQNSETAEVRVEAVLPQTSRSGRVNPVAEFSPIRLRGALIRRATAHHYAMVRDLKIGTGTLIRLSRSGEVIPKIEEVLEPGSVDIPSSCPSCGQALVWEDDWLQCPNSSNCPAQRINSMEHFFKTLGNIDGFGPSSLEKLYRAGITSVREIYALSEDDFQRFGFGPKQAENMIAQLQRSLRESTSDWRFLAAFGIPRMGMGNCEKLLAACPLEKIFDLTLAELEEIKGFSEKIGKEILHGLALIRKDFFHLLELGFVLDRTSVAGRQQESVSAISGKIVVFTGVMRTGKRQEMQKQARELGAKIATSVTGKTDLLVCGEKVGAAKLARAEQLGVEVVTEKEYLDLIRSE